MFGKSKSDDETPTTRHDYRALARKYAAKAADHAEGVLGTNDKSVGFATLAIAFATVAAMDDQDGAA